MLARGRRMELQERPVTLYDWIGGAGTVRRLVEAFYPRVQRDPDLAPIFPADIRPVMEKQYLFLTQFLGGPPLYSERYGPPMLRARHLPHPITPRRRDAWLRCMAAALEDIGLPEEVRTFVLARLTPVADHMVNRPD
jgi:hemoglobin